MIFPQNAPVLTTRPNTRNAIRFLTMGSFDFKDEIWSEMESLSVLDVFCTDSECNTTLRSNFKKKSIFVIFDFFDCGFGHFDLRKFYQKVNTGSTDHFFTNYHQKPPPEKKCPP